MLAFLSDVVIFLVILALILRAVAWYLREYQDKLLYFPALPPNAIESVPRPSEWGLKSWEELKIVTADKTTLHAYFNKQEEDWQEVTSHRMLWLLHVLMIMDYW